MPVAKEVKIGKNTKIYHPQTSNIYGCEIGGECIIGSHVVIQNGVKIGNRVKVNSFAFIPKGVIVEDEVFIGPHSCFTNDLFPRATNPDGTIKTSEDWKLGYTKVCRKASIGAGAVILSGITIGKGAMVGAGSVVTKDVPPWTIVVGNPAKVLREIKDKK